MTSSSIRFLTQVRHQIDLIDMVKNAVKWKGKVYKYILTVQDIFSRYLWLRPLERKTSMHIARELRDLYTEIGPPRLIQSDNGGEFKKAVEKLCRMFSVKIIRGSPYHPQSQGKVERSHRSLRKKISFDLNSFSQSMGVNWAASLANYQKLQNEEPMDVLGNHSPFAVFYGRTSNAVSQRVIGGRCDEESNPNRVATGAQENDYATFGKNRERIRKRAREFNNVWDKRYIQRRMKDNPPSQYELGEKVFIRFPFSKTRRIAPKKRYVIEGKIIKRKLRLHKYEVEYQSPTTKTRSISWVSVEDITSKTREEEQKKKDVAKLKLKKKKATEARHSHKKKFYIPMKKQDYYKEFSSQGYSVSFDPAGDGNCQFDALAHFLPDIGIFRSRGTLRYEVVRHLETNPGNNEGVPLEMFAAMPWSQYLANMASDSTYGDHITLQAFANMFNVKVIIISSLGPEGKVIILPWNSDPIAQVTLGHYAEDQGTHYVCLQEIDASNEINCGEANAYLCDVRESLAQTPQVEFVSDKQVRILAEQNVSVDTFSGIEKLPNEVLEKILRMVIHSASLDIAGYACKVYNQLSAVNTRFRDTLTQRCKHLLPQVYISGGVGIDEVDRVVSVRSLLKKYGRHSGLIKEVEQIISNSKWINAWLKLEQLKYGWFLITRIFWRIRK